MALNVNSSAVDFLKSKGFSDNNVQFPLYDTRKKIYESLGLNSNLGDFRGAANQNTSLISELSKAEKAAGVSINPNNIFDVINTYRGVNNQTSELPNNAEANTNTGSGANSNIPKEETKVPDYLINLAKKAQTPSIDAETLAKQAMEQYTGSPEFKIQSEELASEKQALQDKAKSEAESLINSLASKGLIFSGRKTTGLNTIEADKIANLLGVDRKYALLITQGVQSAAQSIAKEAVKGSEEAAKVLDTLGYVVADGQIIQKPSEARAIASQARSEEAALRAAAAEERAIASAERADIRLGLSQASAQRAEEAANRAAAKFEKDQQNISDYKLSSTLMNKMINVGIPTSVSNKIYDELQQGFTLEDIRVGLAKIYGKDLGYSYLDKFMPIFQEEDLFSTK